jgi:hypothetical protein
LVCFVVCIIWGKEISIDSRETFVIVIIIIIVRHSQFLEEMITDV